MRRILLFYFIIWPFITCYCFDLGRYDHNVDLVDLRKHSFENKTKFPLNSWELYWGQLYEPDYFDNNKSLSPTYLTSLQSWDNLDIDKKGKQAFGYATYRCKVIVNKETPLLALQLPGVFSSAKIWIDKKLIKELGKVGERADLTKHYRRSVTIPFTHTTDTIEFVIQVANFYHKKGGMTTTPVLGNSEYLLGEQSVYTISKILYTGSLAFMGIFFLLFYLFYWRKDDAIVYFAFFCLFWSYRELSASYSPLVDLIPSMSWSVHVKFEYLSLYLGALAGSLFLRTVFIGFAHHSYKKLIIITISIFVIATVLAPSQIYTKLLNLFFLTMVVNLTYILFIVIKAAMVGRAESRLTIFSVILAIIILSLHIFSFIGGNPKYMIYVHIGYLAVFLLNSMLIGMRFANSFFKLEQLQAITLDQKEEISVQADQLAMMNSDLSKKTVQLRVKNEQVVNINKTLEKKVVKRTSRLVALNRELDTFLYKSSHDLRRPVKSMLGLSYLAVKTISDPLALEMFDKVKKSALAMDMLLDKLVEVNEINDHFYKRQTINCGTFIAQVKADVEALISNSDKVTFKFEHPQIIYEDPIFFYKLLKEIFKNSVVWADHIQRPLVINCIIDQSNKKTSIKVVDNGPGIDKHLLPEVTHMYKVANEKVVGDGLGLYIVSKILEKVNGQIKLDSISNRGTTVCIVIPSDNPNGN